MKQKSVKNKNVIVHNDRGDSVRLNKYISESGFCSRREADKLIQSGLVTIDGVKAEMGTKVTKGCSVFYLYAPAALVVAVRSSSVFAR